MGRGDPSPWSRIASMRAWENADFGKKSPKHRFWPHPKNREKSPKNRKNGPKTDFWAIFPIFGRFFSLFSGRGQNRFFGDFFPISGRRPEIGVLGDGRPADVRGSFARISRPKTSVRAVKILKKQAFRRGHPWPEGADVHDPKGFPKTSVRKT